MEGPKVAGTIGAKPRTPKHDQEVRSRPKDAKVKLKKAEVSIGRSRARLAKQGANAEVKEFVALGHFLSSARDCLSFVQNVL